MRLYNILFFCLLLILLGCVEEYPPPVANEEIDFLVVDGSISTSGSATVRLSRTIPLASTEPSPTESNAYVHVEDSDGNIYSMVNQGDGVYEVDNIPVSSDRQYRLYIKRADNREYLSAFVSAKQTPPIDSLAWRPTQLRDGIEILVNTHDETNNTRYYQWTFVETYEYVTEFIEQYDYVNGNVVEIPYEEWVNRCWKSAPSQRIIIGSSEQLSQDIIQNFPITEVPKGSQELSIRYSILVKQRALSKDAYVYWLNLQGTTENLGGLFDPQPGRVNGNIVNTSDLNEPVIGYFDIGDVQEKRIFISSSDLPTDLRSVGPIGCELDTVSVQEVGTIGEIPALAIVFPIVEGITVLAYTYSPIVCTDCRLQGGTAKRPLFWE